MGHPMRTELINNVLLTKQAKHYTKQSAQMSIAVMLNNQYQGTYCGIMDKVLNYGLEVNKFELQLLYCIHFWTITLEKGMNPFIPSVMG